MSATGPIILVDDDKDDQDTFAEILKDLKVINKLIIFDRGIEAFEYLKTTTDQPFIIFSDINLPGQNGLEFKLSLDQDMQLRRKSIPFIFYSTSVDQQSVNVAYEKMSVQGFFKKGNTLSEVSAQLKTILDYWCDCHHPNSTP